MPPFFKCTEGHNPHMGRPRTHASRGVRNAAPQVGILDTFGHQAGLRCFDAPNHFPSEDPPNAHCRLAHIARSQGIGNLRGLPCVKPSDLCIAYKVRMRSFSPFRRPPAQNPTVFIRHPRRDSCLQSYHCSGARGPDRRPRFRIPPLGALFYHFLIRNKGRARSIPFTSPIRYIRGAV